MTSGKGHKITMVFLFNMYNLNKIMKKTEYKPKLAWTLQNGEGHEKERPRICHRLV